MSILSSPLDTHQEQERFILAKLEEITLFFPSTLVTEILTVETVQLLPLPFYPEGVLGCIHHRGQIIPLVSLYETLLGKPRYISKEKLKIVRLNENSGNLRGVGIVVDLLLGSQGKEQIPPELYTTDRVITLNGQKMYLFQSQVLPDELWQPRHWRPSSS
ncbi:CheW protein [Gloeothece citriformis PCC 7424]|uniref:CheW protein n=1 Tax=Gloeothece citriformis (strain PCC 7424) TaxID=65393 RepID=B7KDT6_GLOC7|nr:chemotaxis protein CheW [Gloeothece citriformis]ACK70388.1 CheW protein [Gloeothece citriformis PCC 7424]